jgi:hypothetical protein
MRISIKLIFVYGDPVLLFDLPKRIKKILIDENKNDNKN